MPYSSMKMKTKGRKKSGYRKNKSGMMKGKASGGKKYAGKRKM